MPKKRLKTKWKFKCDKCKLPCELIVSYKKKPNLPLVCPSTGRFYARWKPDGWKESDYEY